MYAVFSGCTETFDVHVEASEELQWQPDELISVASFPET
jgi:hypothetical protein